MSSNNKTPAQAARAAARNFRLRKLDDLDPPVFSAKNPLLPDTVDDRPNQLHSTQRGTEMIIDVNTFDQGEDGKRGYITLFWEGEPVFQTSQFTTPIKDFPVELKLPADKTTQQGTYALSYIVNIVNNETPSLPLEVNIDTTPPNNNGAGAVVTVPPEVEADGITKEYLDANGGKVEVTIPKDYIDAKIGDVVRLMFGTSIPLAEEVGRVTRTDTVAPIVIDLERKHIKTEGDNSLFYRLIDRKGNEGPDSQYKTIPVSLTPAPTGLQPPEVPLAADGLIDYADAVETVKVIIPAYTNWFSSDRVVVTFDGTDHAPQQMPQAGATVSLPYALIYSGNLGEKTSKVTYRIERNGRSFVEPTGKSFKVDLRMPGPDPKDPPETIHPDLVIPTVRGAVSATPNELTEEDADKNVTATAKIFANSKSGQYAQLWWAGKEVAGARYDVLGTEDPNDEMTFTVPWDVVKEAGNGDAIPVHYIVGHDVNDNVYHSGARDVKVSGIKIVLPDPQFLHLDPTFDVLNCPSLQVHSGALVAEISVPGGDERLADQELTFIYQGWSDSAGTVPIDDTHHTFTYTPNADEARDGFIVRLPYLGALENTRQDYGSIHFTVEIEGSTAPSERHLVDVEVLRPGNLACELP